MTIRVCFGPRSISKASSSAVWSLSRSSTCEGNSVASNVALSSSRVDAFVAVTIREPAFSDGTTLRICARGTTISSAGRIWALGLVIANLIPNRCGFAQVEVATSVIAAPAQKTCIFLSREILSLQVVLAISCEDVNRSSVVPCWRRDVRPSDDDTVSGVNPKVVVTAGDSGDQLHRRSARNSLFVHD